MAGIITPFRHGKVKEFGNQYIETEFLLYFIPLSSYFIRISEKEGLIETVIPLNSISLRSYYIPLFLIFGPIILAVFLVTIGSSLFSLPEGLPLMAAYIPFILFLACACYGVYMLVTYGKPEPHEIKRRTVLEMAMGINALPEWLAPDERIKRLNALKASLPANWKQHIVRKEFDAELYYKLYAAIYYENVIEGSPEGHQLFIELDKRINKDLYRYRKS